MASHAVCWLLFWHRIKVLWAYLEPAQVFKGLCGAYVCVTVLFNSSFIKDALVSPTAFFPMWPLSPLFFISNLCLIFINHFSFPKKQPVNPHTSYCSSTNKTGLERECVLSLICSRFQNALLRKSSLWNYKLSSVKWVARNTNIPHS